MLIANFTKSKNVKGEIDYVLSNKNHKGEVRKHKPEVLDGDPQLTIEFGKYCKKFSHEYIGGCISFSSQEKPTKEQMLYVIEQFKQTFFGNMEDRVNAVFTLHRGKTDHIHYQINRLDLETKLHYNPFPPGQQTFELMKNFSSMINHELGYKQIEEDTEKSTLSKGERKAIEWNFGEAIKDKVKFENACLMLVKNGDIKNRKELIEFLKSENIEISREGENYLSIVKEGRNLRMKGGIFAKNSDRDYEEVKKEEKQRVKSFNYEETKRKVEQTIAKRNDYNRSRYEGLPPPPPAQSHQDRLQAIKSRIEGRATTPTSKTAQKGSIAIGGGTAQARITGAQLALAQAESDSERAQAQAELDRALADLRKEQEEQQQQKGLKL